MSDEKRRIAPTAPLRTSLADALAARGVSVSATPAVPLPTAPLAAPPPADVDLSRAAKVVLRRERKGHGGKTVTVVAGLGLAPRALERVARDLKRTLGCGATVSADTIVLQGDLAARAEPWLAARGVRRIVIGS